MSASRGVVMLLAAIAAAGCSWSGGQLGTLQTQNRSLLEQNKAQLAEIENLKAHARRLEDRLIDAEQRLASLPEAVDAPGEQLASKRQGDRSSSDN